VASKRKRPQTGHLTRDDGRQNLPGGDGTYFPGVTGAVQALYEEYPYPQFRQIFVRPDAAASLGYIAHRCYRPEPFRPRRILVAGCGTTQAVSTAASHPTASVLGIDISQESLRICERMAGDLGLKNLQVEQEDLLTFSGHDEQFDLIDCYGVLHHTADPLLGLRTLARALSPDGLMSVMVYSQRVRHEIGEFQQVYRMLNRVREGQGGDASLKDRMALARRLAGTLAGSNSRLNRTGQMAVAMFSDDRTRFADTYVQPREVRYTLDEVLKLVRGADLELRNFAHEREWDPGAYLDDSALLARVRSLPREDRWRFCDTAGSPFYHFLCAHPASGGVQPRPCLADDPLMLALVPHAPSVHSYPLRNNRVLGPAVQEPREGVTFIRQDGHIRFRGTLGEMQLPPIALEYIRLADGRRTVREIAAIAASRQGANRPATQAEVAAAFRAIFGMIPFLTADTTQCHGCPLRAAVGSTASATSPGTTRSA
jgi:SAM-dependent methyltransferase